MRKLLAMTLAMLLMFSLVACGGGEGAESGVSSSTEEVSTPSNTGESTTTTSASGSDTSDGSTTSTPGKSTTSGRNDKPSTTTTTETKFVLPTSGNWEKPVTINTAVLYNKQTSSYDSKAETMRQSILNTKDTLKASGSGKTYYISYRGSDANDGLSPNTPWKSPAKAANKMSFKSGDVILFERGGVYRDVAIQAASGVSYGAYGKGAKPQLYGSDKNYADESLWTKTSTANVWKATVTQMTGPTAKEIEDVGNVIIDYGKKCASDGKKMSVGKLAADYDFYYDAKSNTLYLYLAAGNPGKMHTSIEIAPNEHVFQVGNAKNVTIENLCIKYTGAHGISCGATSGTTVRGCEIGYIGGGLLTANARFGNGIEFFGNVSNCTVENNWIYQCFDAGYTNQGPSSDNNSTITGWHTNINVKNNLIEYCAYNIEVWTIKDAKRGGMKNCTFSDNILRFAGYGFGSNARYGSSTSAIGNISLYNYVIPCQNTVIKNNVFDCSYRYVISIAYPNDAQGRGPTITGNTWIQKPFKNDDSEAVVGQSYLTGNQKVYKCATLDEMKASVAIFDKAPASVILEK